MIEDKINELRTKHAVLAGVLERIHKMDLRETAIGDGKFHFMSR